MRRMAGSGLIDFLIILATGTILLAVAVPSAGTIRDGRKVDRILELTEALGQAAHRFHADTGRFALEFSASEDGSSYVHPRFHELSMPQAVRGWQGPYLDSPLRQSDSPFGAAVYLVNDLGVAPANGFRLERGGEELRGSGQYLIIHGVNRRLAEACDRRIDGNDNERDWQTKGRCEWVPEGGGSLSIFLMQAPVAEEKPR